MGLSDFENDKIEIEEPDPQVDAIDKMTDEELEAAKQLTLEELAEPEKGTSANDDGTQTGNDADKIKGTSDDQKTKEELEAEKVKTDDEAKAKAEADKAAAETFVLTEDVINSQPEEVRGLLGKYKGKSKDEIAKAAAHAVAFKNPYLKDDEKAIEYLTNKFKAGTDDDLMRILIDTQKETGNNLTPAESKPEPAGDKVVLPPIDESNPEIVKALETETIIRLKKKYPGMPDDLSSFEYKEWLRDKDDEDPEFKNNFFSEKNKIASEVKTGAQKIMYIQQNHTKINNTNLEKEVALIKTELKNKYGVSDPEKELGINLKLDKDENGIYFNESLNSLMLKGNQPDPDVVENVHGIKLLKSGSLYNKYIQTLTPQILDFKAKKLAENNLKEIERLKAENLNSLGTQRTNGQSKDVLSIEDIEKINDPAVIASEKEKLLNSF